MISIHKQVNKIFADDSKYAIKNQFDKLLAYFKPFEGRFEKSCYKSDTHKFYDEREWRYVEPGTFHPPLPEEKFKSLKPNDRCVRHLDFTIDLLKEVVVTSQEEKDELKELIPGNKVKIHYNRTQ